MARSQEFRPARTSFPWPTPRPQSSDWMRELSEALRPHPDSGIGSEDIVALSNNFSGFSDNNTLNTPPPGAELGRILYTKLQKFPHLRQALSSVNAALSNTGLGLLDKKGGTRRNLTFLEGSKLTKADNNFDLG